MDLTNGTSCLRWACDVDKKGAFDSHRTIAIQRDLGTQQGRHMDSSEREMKIGRHRFDALDRSSRSQLDRGKITTRFGPRLFPSDGPRSSCNRDHQFHFLTGSNGLKNRAKISFKKTMYSLFSLQLLIDS